MIWSTADLLATVAEARKLRPEMDVRIVAHTREASLLSAAAPEELGLPELSSRLGYRVAYSEALARVLSGCEWLDRNAHAEMDALVLEVQNILRKKQK